jgi:hypothetical protein
MFAVIARLPQPLKALYVVFFVVLAGTAATFLLGGQRAVLLATELLGVVAVLVGLTIGTNLNGGAEALAEAMKSYRPLGVDYSRSVLASPGFTRLSGFMMLVVGVIFIAQAAAQL